VEIRQAQRERNRAAASQVGYRGFDLRLDRLDRARGVDHEHAAARQVVATPVELLDGGVRRANLANANRWGYLPAHLSKPPARDLLLRTFTRMLTAVRGWSRTGTRGQRVR